MNPEHAEPYSSRDDEEEMDKPRSRNDDPDIIYSRAWWIANGIDPQQIMSKREVNL